MPTEAAARQTSNRLTGLLASPLLTAMLGALLLWLAQPGTLGHLGQGVSYGWIGWFAPAPWVWLILSRRALGRWRYAQIWLAGWAYWMLTLHWLRLPHPLTIYGWPLLCGYFAVYLTLFIGVCRTIMHRTLAPVWLVAPVVWVALEYVQAHLFTGFQMGALSHTQAAYPVVLQVAEWGGGYAVSLVLMMTAASLTVALRHDTRLVHRAVATLATVGVAAGALYYGQWSLRHASPRPGPAIALIQGATLAVWDHDPDRSQRIMNAQTKLTATASEAARKEGRTLDLIIWPESMFRVPVITVGDQILAAATTPERYRPFVTTANEWLTGLATTHGAPLLLGADRFDVQEEGDSQKVYNSVILTDPAGRITGYYDKTHRVPFGEYIPFAKNMPALYFLTPMEGGLGEGRGPVALTTATSAGPITLCPSICYESVLPHVIRRHVSELATLGQPPDLLVNVTNDAWFWGSSELDLHLACGVLRAVENRTPLAVSANTGLSAIVDASGQIKRVSTRMQEDVIVDTVPLDDRTSFYTRHGDWFALGCVAITLWLLAIALVQRQPPATPEPRPTASGTP